MNRVYISDLDGTLLRNDATLSDYSRRSLTKLINDGIKFTVASARNIYSIKEILGDLPLELPIIGGNGAYVTDYKTGEHFIVNYIYNEICFELLDIIKKYDCKPFISSYDGKKNNLYYEETNNYGMEWYLEDRIKAKDKRLKQVKDLRKIFKEDIVGFTMMNRKENLMELIEYLQRTYSDVLEIHAMDNQYSPGWYWLTINDKKATKREGINNLIKRENLEGYEIVVFGDNINDMPMFMGADRAIAVENAKEELKKYAVEIIGKNEDDSVIDFILKDVYENPVRTQIS